MVLENVSRLARAVEASWCAAWASLGAVRTQPPSYVDATAEYLRVCTPGMPEMLVNTVLRYAGPVSANDVERVIAPYRRYHLPFQWWLTLGEEPRGLRDELHRLRMQSCGTATCMALPLDSWQPPDPTLGALPQERAGRVSGAEGRVAHEIICEVFYVPFAPMARWTTENPAFQLYLTSLADRPVSALATLRDGETVGVYHVATLPGYRRRGLAGRLLALALSEARASGARLATLTATPEAHMLYESLGFVTCGLIEQWIPSADLMARLRQGDRAPRTAGGGWW
jgi:GNAT superfamily N-acetyltransferase